MKIIIKVRGLSKRKRSSSKSAVDYLSSLQESFTASSPSPLLNCLFLLEFSISTALLVLNSVEVTLPISTKQIQQHSLNLSFAMMLERKPRNGWSANTLTALWIQHHHTVPLHIFYNPYLSLVFIKGKKKKKNPWG